MMMKQDELIKKSERIIYQDAKEGQNNVAVNGDTKAWEKRKDWRKEVIDFEMILKNGV